MELFINATTGKPHARFIRKHILAAHAILKPALSEFSIALVGDKRMAELHEQFLGIPGPTDVLTFPLEVGRRGKVLAGEVVVCVPEAKRQAAGRGRKVEHEILLYALHGLLHLCGYDDRTARDFRRMHRAEDMILTKLGIGPVFADPRTAGVSPASSNRSKTRARRPRHNSSQEARR